MLIFYATVSFGSLELEIIREPQDNLVKRWIIQLGSASVNDKAWGI